MSSDISILVKDFRAVKKAEITIDGITLVAGVNGCGKSTISKLLYYAVNTITNFDYLVRFNLNEELYEISFFLRLILREALPKNEETLVTREYLKQLSDLREDILSMEHSLEDCLSSLVSVVNEVGKIFDKQNLFYDPLQPSLDIDDKNSNFQLINSSSRNKRIKRIFSDFIQIDINGPVEDNPFDEVVKLVNTKFEIAKDKIENRPTSLILDELKKVFEDGVLPSKLELKEFDDVILSVDSSFIKLLFSTQKAIYVDTPMMFAVRDSKNPYWEDLQKLLLNNSKSKSNKVADIISNQIIGGDVECSSETFMTDDFKFKRIDNAIFNLLDMATGIKSFSIIQILLKNGHLDDKTLLIIDEPESNLHPQWIVEYARVIVLLHKELKAKFFLASHNPDMVNAIRYIAEKEGVIDSTNFYLAKKEEKGFEYSYENLHHDIEPIFESFNVALDKIIKYGTNLV